MTYLNFEFCHQNITFIRLACVTVEWKGCTEKWRKGGAGGQGGDKLQVVTLIARSDPPVDFVLFLRMACLLSD
eukprot:763367-Hanusia_phi.AAC.2